MSYVLIVDDKEENRYYLQALLQGHGFTVKTARHGAEALVLARQVVPDLVISDLLMPIMDGYTLLRHWKVDKRLSAVPFIVYTATYTEAEDEKLALDLGADAFILKPAEPEEFLARMQDVQQRPAAEGPEPSKPSRADETDVLKHYSQTLIRKLEEKSLQLEEANRLLQQDISRREAAEAALRVSEERFRLLARATNDAIWDWDIAEGRRWWGGGFADLFGHRHGGAADNNSSWADLIHTDDRERVLSLLQQAMQQGDTWFATYRFQRADGSWAHVEDRGHLLRNEQGRAVRMIGGLSDVTERAALEERLRKSQRLEAIGQLTGGVAHDFNNLLTVVMGNAEYLVEDLQDDPIHRELAQMIVDAAERGADLTRRLLAFAHKQTLSPKAVQLKDLISGVTPILQRVLTKKIQIHVDAGDHVPLAIVDPGQLEHALLNLCVNARDAMPDGGVLTIALTTEQIDSAGAAGDSTVAAGRYVALSIADTGVGIPPEHLPRVYDPFFSTKEEGKGSGLGLAMVYGFVNQSGGQISVTSEPGQGATFKLLLPAAPDGAAADEDCPQNKKLATGSETILLVEDDKLIRQLAQSQLEGLGYRVLSACSGEDVIALLREGVPVDLLFTDVQMSGMDGPELAALALDIRPGLKVLYTSGYTGKKAEQINDIDNTPLPMLGKPYKRADLARAVAHALGRTDDVRAV